MTPERAPRRARAAPRSPRPGKRVISTTHALASTGKRVSQVPVTISYRIIELFSAGLYSSPNKAVEELVSNSYDAMATRVDLFMPADIDQADAAIWVVDNGESMDLDGLRNLWQIATSNKRDDESRVRPPIGKFG